MKNNAMAIGVRTRIIYRAMAIMTILLSIGEHTMAQTKSTTVVKNIVLVHGGLVDGSGWKDVYKILKKDGYTVSIVQEPTISLPDDAAVTKRVIDGQNGPVILSRPLIWRSSDHRSGQRSKGRWFGLRHGIRTGQRRIGSVAH
jgi:hypothetical protein